MNTLPQWSPPADWDLALAEGNGHRNGSTKRALPTHKDLPATDDLPLENAIQAIQMGLLTAVLRPVLEALHPDGRFFVGRDVGIYYRITNAPLDGCKAPDWFYVANVDPLLKGEYRRSYVLWNERQVPTLLVEFAANDGSIERDTKPPKGKFWVYEHLIQGPYYAIFVVDEAKLEVFERVEGHYRQVAANERGRFPIPPIGVELGVWHGTYEGYTLPWLRAYRPDGTLLPTPDERTAALAAKLRALGIDPDQVQ